MRGLSDTSPEAQRVLDGIYRAMPEWRKWELVERVNRLGRHLHAAGVLLRAPEATASQIRDDWVARNYRIKSMPGGPPMADTNELRATVESVVDVLDRLGIEYALGGSLASSIYGVGRSTIDADLCVEPFPGKEVVFAECFGPDYYVDRDAVVAAVRNRSSFNIIATTVGFKVDVFVKKERPFEVSVMARRRPVGLSGPNPRELFVVSPEDVVLLKLEWYRLGNEASERQWSDVVGVLRIQRETLDQDYLDKWAADLGVQDLLTRARGEIGPGGGVAP